MEVPIEEPSPSGGSLLLTEVLVEEHRMFGAGLRNRYSCEDVRGQWHQAAERIHGACSKEFRQSTW